MCLLVVGGQMWVGCGDGSIAVWEIEVSVSK